MPLPIVEARPLEQSFKKTRLYQLLSQRAESGEKARRIVSATERILELAEEVLRAAGTAPLDFTLHDNHHSFRVAERMWIVLPPTMPPDLSTEELALLLLSAYLHDIGMAPDRETLIKYRDLAIGAPNSSITSEERSDFYKWFDSSRFADDLPLPLIVAGSEDLDNLEQLLTYFIRTKHNDWSEVWIRKHGDLFTVTEYPEFLDDLIRLCRSHHYGFDELIKSDYDPKPVGITDRPLMVNLRYLACVLRVADILEFDPERTPDIIYQHRNISRDSRIFWWHSFYLNSTLSADRKKLLFSAHPPNAKLHHALRIVAADINRELLLVRRLNDARPFKLAVAGDLPHHWDLPTELTESITPKDNSYEFIEGSFRPNSAKLLQLLSGSNLYRSSLDGIRELVQNAFDAVKEYIAYDTLQQQDDRPTGELTSDALTVDLRIEEHDGRIYLVCADQGVGMTKHIIENYLLVSGNSRSSELRSLERRLEERGLQLGSTGRFGIGVLSYFMLADQVTITTRRSQLCGDEDPNGWSFETDGVGGFGELRRQSHRVRGTEVRLRIRRQLATRIEDFEEQVAKYFAQVLVRVPCRFRFSGQTKSTTWAPGWTRSSEVFITNILTDISGKAETSEGEELQSSKERAKRLLAAKEWSEIENEIKATLRWHVVSGRLKNGMGFFRAHLPYFEIPGGASLAFMRVSAAGEDLVFRGIDRGHYLDRLGFMVQAWRGVLFSSQHSHDDFFFVEIDWTSGSAGEISVNRWEVKTSSESEEALADLRSNLRRDLKAFVRKHSDSKYHAFNARLSKIPCSEENIYWLSVDGGQRHWARVKFPNRIGEQGKYDETIGEQKVSQVPLLRKHNEEYAFNGVSWASISSNPDRMVPTLSSYRVDITPIFDGPSVVSPRPYVSSQYPPEWKALTGVNVSDLYGWSVGATVWNQDNPLVRKFSEESWTAVREMFPRSRESAFNPLSRRDQLVNDEGFLANFIAQVLRHVMLSSWEALLEKDQELAVAVSTLLASCQLREQYYVQILSGHHKLLGVSEASIQELSASDNVGFRIKELLPRPAQGWGLTQTAKEPSAMSSYNWVKDDPWRHGSKESAL